MQEKRYVIGGVSIGHTKALALEEFYNRYVINNMGWEVAGRTRVILSRTLKSLVRDGLISQHPRYSYLYRITSNGIKMLRAFNALMQERKGS